MKDRGIATPVCGLVRNDRRDRGIATAAALPRKDRRKENFMDDLLDEGLRSIPGLVRELGEAGRKSKGIATAAEQPRNDSQAESWVLGDRDWRDTVKAVGPWAGLYGAVCGICLVYMGCGWMAPQAGVPVMMAACMGLGWMLGRKL